MKSKAQDLLSQIFYISQSDFMLYLQMKKNDEGYQGSHFLYSPSMKDDKGFLGCIHSLS